MRKSRIIEHVSTRDCQECGRVSLIEVCMRGAVWRGPSETVKAQVETITTSQLFPQQ
jgi:hypothetical protein